MSRMIASVVMLAMAQGASCLLLPPTAPVRAGTPLQARPVRRAPEPHASMLAEVAASASSAATAADAATSLLLAASVDPSAADAPVDFGEVFRAGMTIAVASVGATVFVGFLVRSKYDDLEQSFFDAQDEELERDGRQSADNAKTQTAKDFFGDLESTQTPPTP